MSSGSSRFSRVLLQTWPRAKTLPLGFARKLHSPYQFHTIPFAGSRQRAEARRPSVKVFELLCKATTFEADDHPLKILSAQQLVRVHQILLECGQLLQPGRGDGVQMNIDRGRQRAGPLRQNQQLAFEARTMRLPKTPRPLLRFLYATSSSVLVAVARPPSGFWLRHS